eukprot:g36755.t1
MIFFVLLAIIHISYALQESFLPYISGGPQDPRCVEASLTRPCKMANGNSFSSSAYPSDYSCPCYNPAAGSSALPGLAEKLSTSTYSKNFTREILFGDFEQPTDLCFADDVRIAFVTEMSGKVWQLNLSSTVPTRSLWLDISDEVHNVGERGLWSCATEPNFKKTGHVFLLYNMDPEKAWPEEVPGFEGQLDVLAARPTATCLTRFEHDAVHGSRARLDAFGKPFRLPLIGDNPNAGIPVCGNGNAGGVVRFGRDYSLLVAVGDGAGSANPFPELCAKHFGALQNIGSWRAQLPQSLAGKLLRVHPATGRGICQGDGFNVVNPWCGYPNAGVAEAVWALGLRNPISMTRRDPLPSEPQQGPGFIYVTDAAAQRFTEINYVGRQTQPQGPINFGWPCWEGPHPVWFPGNRNSGSESVIPAADRSKVSSLPQAALSCAELYALITTDTGFYYYTAQPGYLQQGAGVTGVAAAGVAVYTDSNYPESLRFNVFIADLRAGSVLAARLLQNASSPHYLHRYDGHISSIDLQASNNSQANVIPGRSMHLVSDPQTKDLCSVHFDAGEITCLRFLPNPQPATVRITARRTSEYIFAFSADGTWDRELDPIWIKWEFGDGSLLEGQANPTHQYSSDGTYTVKLITEDVSGQSQGTITVVAGVKDLKVKILSPQATIPAPDRPFLEPVFVVTTGMLTSSPISLLANAEDVNAWPLSVKWQLQLVRGGMEANPGSALPLLWESAWSTIGMPGRLALAEVPGANETFSSSTPRPKALYRLVATIKDATGVTGSDSMLLRPEHMGTARLAVGNANPVAAWNILGFGLQTPWPEGSPSLPSSVSSPALPSKQPLLFHGLGSSDADGDTLKYFWDFGDATQGNSTAQKGWITHMYSNAGIYKVKLHITDGFGGYAMLERTIWVGSPALVPPIIIPSSGEYYRDVRVHLKAVEPTHEVYYTLNGENYGFREPIPGTPGTIRVDPQLDYFTLPWRMVETVVVQAISRDPGGALSINRSATLEMLPQSCSSAMLRPCGLICSSSMGTNGYFPSRAEITLPLKSDITKDARNAPPTDHARIFRLEKLVGRVRSDRNLELNLWVDAGSQSGGQVQARLLFDFDGDRVIDKTMTFEPFATNDLPDFQLYSSVSHPPLTPGCLNCPSTEGAPFQDFNGNGSVRLEVWQFAGPSQIPSSITQSLRLIVDGAPNEWSTVQLPYRAINPSLQAPRSIASCMANNGCPPGMAVDTCGVCGGPGPDVCGVCFGSGLNRCGGCGECIDGGWSAWSECTAECGAVGTQIRTCTNPAPKNGGANCRGPRERTCGLVECVPVNGAYGPWSECDASCGGGWQQRTCDSPAPKHGGSLCQGESSRRCNQFACTPLCNQFGLLDSQTSATALPMDCINAAAVRADQTNVSIPVYTGFGLTNFQAASTARLVKSWKLSNLYGRYDPRAAKSKINLYVDAGKDRPGSALQARLWYDFDGDGIKDRIETYGYFAVDSAEGYELYSSDSEVAQFPVPLLSITTEASGSSSSVQTLEEMRNLVSGTVGLDLWQALPFIVSNAGARLTVATNGPVKNPSASSASATQHYNAQENGGILESVLDYMPHAFNLSGVVIPFKKQSTCDECQVAAYRGQACTCDYCGDGVCNKAKGENCTSCDVDCGACLQSCTAFSGSCGAGNKINRQASCQHPGNTPCKDEDCCMPMICLGDFTGGCPASMGFKPLQNCGGGVYSNKCEVEECCGYTGGTTWKLCSNYFQPSDCGTLLRGTYLHGSNSCEDGQDPNTCEAADCCAPPDCGSNFDADTCPTGMSVTEPDRFCNVTGCTVAQCCDTLNCGSHFDASICQPSSSVFFPERGCGGGKDPNACEASECCVARSCADFAVFRPFCAAGRRFDANATCSDPTCWSFLEECCRPVTCGTDYTTECPLGFAKQPGETRCDLPQGLNPGICENLECCRQLMCGEAAGPELCSGTPSTVFDGRRKCSSAAGTCTKTDCCVPLTCDLGYTQQLCNTATTIWRPSASCSKGDPNRCEASECCTVGICKDDFENFKDGAYVACGASGYKLLPNATCNSLRGLSARCEVSECCATLQCSVDFTGTCPAGMQLDPSRNCGTTCNTQACCIAVSPSPTPSRSPLPPTTAAPGSTTTTITTTTTKTTPITTTRARRLNCATDFRLSCAAPKLLVATNLCGEGGEDCTAKDCCELRTCEDGYRGDCSTLAGGPFRFDPNAICSSLSCSNSDCCERRRSCVDSYTFSELGDGFEPCRLCSVCPGGSAAIKNICTKFSDTVCLTDCDLKNDCTNGGTCVDFSQAWDGNYACDCTNAPGFEGRFCTTRKCKGYEPNDVDDSEFGSNGLEPCTMCMPAAACFFGVQQHCTSQRDTICTSNPCHCGQGEVCLPHSWESVPAKGAKSFECVKDTLEKGNQVVIVLTFVLPASTVESLSEFATSVDSPATTTASPGHGQEARIKLPNLSSTLALALAPCMEPLSLTPNQVEATSLDGKTQQLTVLLTSSEAQLQAEQLLVGWFSMPDSPGACAVRENAGLLAHSQLLREEPMLMRKCGEKEHQDMAAVVHGDWCEVNAEIVPIEGHGSTTDSVNAGDEKSFTHVIWGASTVAVLSLGGLLYCRHRQKKRQAEYFAAADRYNREFNFDAGQEQEVMDIDVTQPVNPSLGSSKSWRPPMSPSVQWSHPASQGLESPAPVSPPYRPFVSPPPRQLAGHAHGPAPPSASPRGAESALSESVPSPGSDVEMPIRRLAFQPSRTSISGAEQGPPLSQGSMNFAPLSPSINRVDVSRIEAARTHTQNLAQDQMEISLHRELVKEQTALVSIQERSAPPVLPASRPPSNVVAMSSSFARDEPAKTVFSADGLQPRSNVLAFHPDQPRAEGEAVSEEAQPGLLGLRVHRAPVEGQEHGEGDHSEDGDEPAVAAGENPVAMEDGDVNAAENADTDPVTDSDEEEEQEKEQAKEEVEIKKEGGSWKKYLHPESVVSRPAAAEVPANRISSLSSSASPQAKALPTSPSVHTRSAPPVHSSSAKQASYQGITASAKTLLSKYGIQLAEGEPGSASAAGSAMRSPLKSLRSPARSAKSLPSKAKSPVKSFKSPGKARGRTPLKSPHRGRVLTPTSRKQIKPPPPVSPDIASAADPKSPSCAHKGSRSISRAKSPVRRPPSVRPTSPAPPRPVPPLPPRPNTSSIDHNLSSLVSPPRRPVPPPPSTKGQRTPSGDVDRQPLRDITVSSPSAGMKFSLNVHRQPQSVVQSHQGADGVDDSVQDAYY